VIRAILERTDAVGRGGLQSKKQEGYHSHDWYRPKLVTGIEHVGHDQELQQQARAEVAHVGKREGRRLGPFHTPHLPDQAVYLHVKDLHPQRTESARLGGDILLALDVVDRLLHGPPYLAGGVEPRVREASHFRHLARVQYPRQLNWIDARFSPKSGLRRNPERASPPFSDEKQ